MHSYFGERVQGAAHIKNRKPCQDAIFIKDINGAIIAGVADGHGSENCPYSAEGAQAAVEVVWEVFSHIIDNNSSEQVFTTLTANKEIWLPKHIENTWRQKIRDIHSAKEPGYIPDEAIYHLYGTTVLGVVVTELFLFALQLGDGDILYIDDSGNSRWLIEPDYIDGNETYSLCIKNCWENIKTCILPLDNSREAPAMIMLSTDGYANSFTSPAGFLKAGTDIYSLIKQEGADYVREHLTEWLTNSSRNGSGDDITLALIFQS